jgi:hypothetical protein
MAKAMWLNLQAVHETKSPQSTIATICNLFHTKATEGQNINEHLTVLQQHWEKIMMMQHTDFKMPDSFFKVIISSSLLSSWDTFTESYVEGCVGENDTDPKRAMSSQEFIGIIKEQYLRCLAHAGTECTNQMSLVKRVGLPTFGKPTFGNGNNGRGNSGSALRWWRIQNARLWRQARTEEILPHVWTM